jgi:hypothetical protein
MAASADIKRPRWPRDLNLFAVLAALSAAALTARIVIRDVTYDAQMPLQAVLLGIRFEGYGARLVLIAQAAVVFVVAIGLAAERRWGLVLAMAALTELVASNLIFMLSYMDDVAEGHYVRSAGWIGMVAVVALLYVWIRARDLLLDGTPRV